MHAPLLISLPHGLNASGVTMWAVRLVNTLTGAGRACALVVHDEPTGQRSLADELAIHPRVDMFDARSLPSLDDCAGDIEPFMPIYRLAAGALAARTRGMPVVCSPNILGDSYAIVAALSRERGVRCLAAHHSDLAYNDRVCAHYEPMVHAFVGVSSLLATRLRSMLPSRARDVIEIPYGVESTPTPPYRSTLSNRPIRLLYAGRLDHEQKRIGALAVLSDRLAACGIAHELLVMGDGPASTEVEKACTHRPSMRRLPARGPDGVREALAWADLFVLASRYEGLSVSLLEAMGAGCVPVVTPTASGASQLVSHGQTGLSVSVGSDASEEEAGSALARALADVLARGLPWAEGLLARARLGGWELVRSSYSAERCAARWAAVIDHAAAMPERPWRGSPAFTGSGAGASGTVPAFAGERLGRILAGLFGRRVVVHGTGRHTQELRGVFERSGATIAVFADDDPARCGGVLWGVPVVQPERAGESGASDVVISSWLHEEAIWSRRGVYESRGLRVHRVYASSDKGPSAQGAWRPGL